MNNHDHITFVLDRSGSMASIRRATIDGSNNFIESQKLGDASFTLIQFDDEYEILYDSVNIKDVPKLSNETFFPRGTTALLGAIGRAIDETGAKLAALPKLKRPRKVYFIVNTDGRENASQSCSWSEQYTLKKVNDMINHQKSVYNWEFIFLGANQDAIASASSIGISPECSITYTSNEHGVENLYDIVSQNLIRARLSNTGFNFTDQDRIKMKASRK